MARITSTKEYQEVTIYQFDSCYTEILVHSTALRFGLGDIIKVYKKTLVGKLIKIDGSTGLATVSTNMGVTKKISVNELRFI